MLKKSRSGFVIRQAEHLVLTLCAKQVINHANRFVKAAFQLWDIPVAHGSSVKVVNCATDLYYR